MVVVVVVAVRGSFMVMIEIERIGLSERQGPNGLILIEHYLVIGLTLGKPELGCGSVPRSWAGHGYDPNRYSTV